MRYRTGHLTLDTSLYRLSRDDEQVDVEPQVFNLLVYLVENRDRVVTREELLDTLWKGRVVSDSALSARLKGARKAVGDTGQAQKIIKTIHRIGYQFIAEVSASSASDIKVEERVSQSLSDKPVIAVIPFRNLSSDPEQEYFSDGITEDIITELSRFPILSVIARHSSFMFKEDKAGVNEIAEKLGVQYIIEGSVRRAGSQVRIAAQLIEADTGNHIWAENYDCEPEDIFAVQDEVTRAIAASISAQLGKTLSEGAARKPATSIRSYEYLLQGNRSYYRFNPAGNIEAASLYRKAIERDPQFARGYAGLANTYTTDYFLGWQRTRDALQKGLECAQKALEFDSNDALARTILAWALIGNGHWEEAEFELDRVLSSKPGDADVLAEAGNGFKAVGRIDDGIDLLREAIRLNPLSPDLYQRWLGQAYYRARRYQEAANALQVIRLEGWGYGWLAASFARCSEDERACEALEAFIVRRKNELESAGVSTNTTVDLLGNYKENFRYEVDWEHFLEGLRMAGLTDKLTDKKIDSQ